MQEIYRVMARLIQTDLTVMITGESGTGKELVARALHDYGQRRKGPFVAINMAAIPRELIESELFGHEKGAFTGAQARTMGRFEQADGGTLFLDEIGDMPMEAQTRLLRVLQEGEYMTVGGRTPIKTDVRIIAATNKNLDQTDQPGPVPRGSVLPPERRADAAAAVARAAGGRARSRPPFPRRRAKKNGLPHKAIQPEALERLKRYQLARQRPRAGKPGAPPDGALFRRKSSPPTSSKPSSRRASPRASMRSESEANSLSEWMEGYLADYFSSFGDAPAAARASTTASCATWKAR